MVKLKRMLALSSLALVSSTGMVGAAERGLRGRYLDSELLFTNLLNGLREKVQGGSNLALNSSWIPILERSRRVDEFCLRCRIPFTSNFEFSMHDLHVLFVVYGLLCFFTVGNLTGHVVFVKSLALGLVYMFAFSWIDELSRVIRSFLMTRPIYNLGDAVFPVVLILFIFMQLVFSYNFTFFVLLPTYLVLFMICFVVGKIVSPKNAKKKY